MVSLLGCCLWGEGWGRGRGCQRRPPHPWFSTVHLQSLVSLPRSFIALYGQQEHGSYASICFLAMAQVMDVAPGHSSTVDTDKAHRGSPCYGHHHSLRWQHKPLTSIWPPVAAWPADIDMASGLGIDHEHPYGIRS